MGLIGVSSFFILILVLIFAALRPALKVLLAPPVTPAMPVIGGVLVRDDEDDASVPGGHRSKAERARAAADEDEGEVIDTAGPYEKKLEAARHAVGQDPKRVAQVVKSWLAEDGAS